jgi:hypothetical protein
VVECGLDHINVLVVHQPTPRSGSLKAHVGPVGLQRSGVTACLRAR